MALPNRRAMLAAGAATAVAGAFGVAGASEQVEGDEALRDLWWRYIEATVCYCEASHAEEKASSDAGHEIVELDVPWSFNGVIEPHALVGPKANLWRCYEVRRVDYADERRVTIYLEAMSIEQARDASKAALAPAQIAYDKAVKAIRRKHHCRALERERGTRHAVTVSIAREIAEAQCEGPAGAAVKMALGFVGFMEFGTADLDAGIDPHGAYPDTGFAIVDAEHAALASVYRDLVNRGGYDPVAEWRKTPGV